MHRRIRYSGLLRMQSALHVGGGTGTQSLTDAGVLRHADGRPFIPGSSMKGVLRSHLERLAQAPVLQQCGIESCSLYADPLLETSCPTPTWQQTQAERENTTPTENDLVRLCHTCTLFGSPLMAGKVRIPDLEIEVQALSHTFEIRDGVGIDRDSGLAVNKIKFDYEVVPAGTAFHFSWTLENPDVTERALAAIAIRDLQRGYLSVGGKTTRGLGSCVLENLVIEDVDFTDMSALVLYLQEHDGGRVDDADHFLNACIDALFDA